MAQNSVRLVESGEHSPTRHPGYGGDEPWYMGVPTLMRNQLFKCFAMKLPAAAYSAEAAASAAKAGSYGVFGEGE